jgi:hypothetical protein
MVRVSMAEWMPPMSHSQGAHRHDASACPPRLDDDRAADPPVRCMAACVAERERDALGVRPVVAAAPGRPSDPPGARLTRDMDGDLDR